MFILQPAIYVCICIKYATVHTQLYIIVLSAYCMYPLMYNTYIYCYVACSGQLHTWFIFFLPYYCDLLSYFLFMYYASCENEITIFYTELLYLTLRYVRIQFKRMYLHGYIRIIMVSLMLQLNLCNIHIKVMFVFVRTTFNNFSSLFCSFLYRVGMSNCNLLQRLGILKHLKY